jgi:glycosyltransferase involved in cell wall biosynthesis
MKILFVHNNFPAQFRNLAGALTLDPSNSVAAIGSQTSQTMTGVHLIRYQTPSVATAATHPFARRFDAECRRAEEVLFAATKLATSGFLPDLIVVHCGWGENLPLRAVFPRAKIVVYCEFYYRPAGQDVHFDPETSRFGADGIAALHCKNASTLLALADCDMGLSPTYWQRSTYPQEFQAKIAVGHEGVDTVKLRPSPSARFAVPGGPVLHKGQEIVTFVSRNLEPMRGFHVFMRALPRIQRERPEAHILIVGGEGTSYGPPPTDGVNWKTVCLDENVEGLDLSRVHFLNRLSFDAYVSVLQISSVHVYLTYPFVLSWSLLEAMAVGCPIVASDTPPVREVVNGSNGLLAPFFDSGALANAVIYLLAVPAKGRELGAAARETARSRFESNICIPHVLNLLGLGNEKRAVNF